MARPALLAAAIFAAFMAAAGPAAAQGAFTGAAPGASASEPQVAAPGLIDRLSAAIRVQQLRYHRRFSTAIRSVKEGHSPAAALGLVAIAFIYGIFHAAGPGHGKAVISAYMLANERSIRRGVILSALAALAQAVTAIVLVYGLVAAAGAAGRKAQLVAGDMEILSYGLIAALGAYLLWRSLRPLLRFKGATPAAATAGTAHGAHHHDHGCGPDCGHMHAPDPAELDRPLTLATALPIVATIGVRPCSGAIVILIFAHTLALHAAGIAATLAMAAGTAITVAGLAVLAVGSRELAATLIGRHRPMVAAFYRAVAIAGAAVVLCLGLLLLHGALTAPARPFP